MSLQKLASLSRQLKASDPHDRAAQARHLEYVCQLSTFVQEEGTPELASCLLASAHTLEALAGAQDDLDRPGLHKVVRKLIDVVGSSLAKLRAEAMAKVRAVDTRRNAPTEKSTLGHILLRLNHITRDQLADALRAKRANGLPLGECLLLLGICPPDRLLSALKLQRRLRHPEEVEPAVPIATQTALDLEQPAGANEGDRPDASFKVTKDMFLGEVLLGAEMITNEQLEQAMHMHHLEGIRVGDALVRMGALTREDIESGLELQKHLQHIAPSFARSHD